MAYKKYTTLLFFTVILFLSLHIKAESENTNCVAALNEIDKERFENDAFEFDESESCEENAIENKPYYFVLDLPHDYISSGVESMVRSIDEYFSDSEGIYDSSGSYLLLRENMTFTEGGNIGLKNDIYFRLRLPNTEKKLKIFFESSSNQPFDTSQQSVTKSTEAVENTNYIAGIQGESGEKFGWKYRPTIGLRLNSAIETYIRFKFNSEYKFSKWTINWYETPYWDSSFGWGFDSYFELNRKISEKQIFRSSTFVGWNQIKNEYNLSHVLSMFHNFESTNTLSYYIGTYGIRDARLYTTQFLLGLNYRQKIYKDYLFYSLSPQVIYQEINNFKPEHSLTLRLEMYFKK